MGFSSPRNICDMSQDTIEPVSSSTDSHESISIGEQQSIINTDADDMLRDQDYFKSARNNEYLSSSSPLNAPVAETEESGLNSASEGTSERQEQEGLAEQKGGNTSRFLWSGSQYFMEASFFTEWNFVKNEFSKVRRTFRRGQPYATDDEKKEAYNRERFNWIKNDAMKIVPKVSVPEEANIVRSSVIYNWKDEANVTSRIVPDGRGDADKHFLRSDSPTMTVDAFRLLISIAAQRNWILSSLEIIAAL